MKKRIKTLFAALILFAAPFAGPAQTLFSDSLNYPNGPIVGDGLWYAYNTNTTSAQDALVANHLLILNQDNAEAVAVPFTNAVSSTTYASFTINVSELPTGKGGYFFIFADTNDDAGGHVFIDRLGTAVPGTYRLGVANFATSITTALTTNFPLDMATGITYQVVVSYDLVLGASLQVNPSSANDLTVYPTDHTGTAPASLSQISFSQYANQGVSAIGNVNVGIGFTDVDGVATNPPLPVIGIQPQSATNYSGNSTAFYTAASGLDLTYQWYCNGVALVDDGVTIFGSTSNILSLSKLTATATYYVVVTDVNGAELTSATAWSTVITTPTQPIFTTQPYGLTNSVGSTITLTGAAMGTGPISYQWFFAPSNSTAFSPVSGQTTGTLSLPDANGSDSGSYYLQAANSAGTSKSAAVSVLITPPPLVAIGYLHSLLVTNPPIPSSVYLGNNETFNVQGVVTTYGQIESKTTSEFFVQDATGGALVYFEGVNPTNNPPAGSLVSVVGVAQEYYGQIELDPNVSAGNVVTIISSGATNGLALPAPAPLNIGLIATNTMGSYGTALQGSLVTMTNVYIYASKTGAPVSGNFPTNGTKALYAFASSYSAGQPYVTVYVFTYTNVVNQLNTNYWGQPLPSFAYAVTGALDIYSTNTPEVLPSRYSDFVTTATPPFFTMQPSGVTNITGATIDLTATAGGTGPISYQWFFAPSNSAAFSPLSGQTSGTLILTNAQVAWSGSYYLQATNIAGSSNSATVSVLINFSATPVPPFFTTQPSGVTNVIGSTIDLTGAAGGTGPISYQWFFAPANSAAFSPLSGQTSGTLILSNAQVAWSGSYYLQATNVAGGSNSATVSVLITPQPVVSIGYLHTLLTTNPPIPNSVSLGNGDIYNVQGVVTTFGQIESKTTAEFFIQDATGGALVYFAGVNPTNIPPAGSLVTVSAEAQEYYGQLELDPSASAENNGMTIVSSGATNGLALPAPAPLNIGLIATNTMGSYGVALQGSLVTMSNVYIYSSKTGAPVSGNFPTNSTKALYAFASPYSAGQPYVTVYVFTYTNVANQLNTNYWGQPIPAFAYSVTGALDIYSTNTPEVLPSRYANFVTTATPPFFTTQPSGVTNIVGSTIDLTGAANGTGPISYQWFFAPSNSAAFSPLSGQTNGTLSLTNAQIAWSGSYYLQAANIAGSSNSATVSVLITPLPMVSIGYLHTLLTTNPPIPNSVSLGNGDIYNVQGVVTTFGQIESKTTAEFFIQDATGGALVYFAGVNPTNIPPAGSLVTVSGEAQEYYGQLELDPSASGGNNGVTIVSSGATNDLALPTPAPLNLGSIATNTMGSYGVALQGSLVTLTNVYIYSSKTGAAVSGNFPTNSTKALYAFAGPYSAGQPYVTIYVYTYTNAVNQLNTNYWGQPIPAFAYEVTGALDIYSTNTPEVLPSRYADIVTTLPQAFNASLTTTMTAGGLASTLTWPAVTGATYSVYSATNLNGPWARTFGVGYYPSGTYTDTNSAPAEFYRLGAP